MIPSALAYRDTTKAIESSIAIGFTSPEVLLWLSAVDTISATWTNRIDPEESLEIARDLAEKARAEIIWTARKDEAHNRGNDPFAAAVIKLLQSPDLDVLETHKLRTAYHALYHQAGALEMVKSWL